MKRDTTRLLVTPYRLHSTISQRPRRRMGLDAPLELVGIAGREAVALRRLIHAQTVALHDEIISRQVPLLAVLARYKCTALVEIVHVSLRVGETLVGYRFVDL